MTGQKPPTVPKGKKRTQHICDLIDACLAECEGRPVQPEGDEVGEPA